MNNLDKNIMQNKYYYALMHGKKITGTHIMNKEPIS